MKRVVILFALLLISSVSAKRRSKQGRCNEDYQKGIELVQKGKNSRAVQVLSNVRIECIGGIAEPDTLYYYIGEAYLNGKKPAEARLEYRTIVEDYPHSSFLEEAAYKMAYCSFKSAPIKERDSRVLRRAMREFNTFIATYPTSEWADTAASYVDSVYNRLIEKELANARFYEIVEKWDAAIIYYRSILEEYPNSSREDFVQLQIIKNMVDAHRFTEARKLMTDLADRGLYIDELKAQQSKIARMIEKQERANNRRKRKNKKKES